jgi:GNAT superfamily N-acetyltransferase
MDEFVVAPVTPRDAPALALLMKREGTPCFCRYWHFAGTNKEWEARCALEPERSEREMAEAIGRGDDEGRGLIAKADEVVVGWMKLTWRKALPKLVARVPYRDLDLDPARVLSIGCFVVDPAMRRRGVARALVKGAIDVGATWGATAIEAYPRRSDHPLHDGEAWTGPERLFVELGFVVARQAPQYPVLRRAL